MDPFNNENTEKRKKLLDEAEEAKRQGNLGESASKFMDAFDLLPNPSEMTKQKKMNKNTPLVDNAASNKTHSHYFFTHELPINGDKMRKAFVSINVLIGLCAVAYVLSHVLWDQFTYLAFSIKTQSIVLKGWPIVAGPVSLGFGIFFIIVNLFMYFMQDWKNPSLALTHDGLFINQGMIRNTLVPFSNIARIEKVATGYKPVFIDNKTIVSQQVFLFRPFVKTNLEKELFVFTGVHTAGDLDAFFSELHKKIEIKL